MFRDDAVIFLCSTLSTTDAENIEIQFEHCIDGPGNWVFGYTTLSDFRVACVGRNTETGKPEVKWNNPA